MKIYRKVVFEWDKEKKKYIEVYSDSYQYSGEVALCRDAPPPSVAYTMPPRWARPYIRGLGKDISILSNTPLQWYNKGPSTAGFTREQNLAHELATKFGREGFGATNLAGAELGKILGGSYLGQPIDTSYLNATLAGRDVAPI